MEKENVHLICQWLIVLVYSQESEESMAASFEEKSRKFLAMWSFVTARVLSDLTLRSAPSFGMSSRYFSSMTR